MTGLVLPGFAPSPLASYLAALGMFRVVAEQFDRNVTARWERDQFVLDGIDEERLVAFLLNDFAPTPVFSPWNKDGNPNLNKTPRNQLAELCAESAGPRFAGYRETLTAWRSPRVQSSWASDDKSLQLHTWRACAPDSALGWLDAAFVLGLKKPAFPPLLGSGGNDGRFEFANLLHGELIRLFVDPKAGASTPGWLHSLLHGFEGPALVESTTGMFDGNSAGSPGSSPLGSAKSASNPWAIVLMFEGLIAFSASIASRAGSGSRVGVAGPFMLRAGRLGDDSSASEDARGELWAPLWSSRASWHEVRRLLAEGRVSWAGRSAAGTVDAARGAAELGVDRGIDAFERHQIVKRNGLAFLAAPAGRVAVRPTKGVARLAGLDRWLDGARKLSRSSVPQAARAVDQAMLAVAASEGSPEAYQDVLSACAVLEMAMGSTAEGRERGPLPSIRATTPSIPTDSGAPGEQPTSSATASLPRVDEWLELLDDGTPEFDIARGLASLNDGPTRASHRGSSADAEAVLPSVALTLRGLVLDRSDAKVKLAWAPHASHRDPAALDAWGSGDRVTETILGRRVLSTCERPLDPADDPREVRAPYRRGHWASQANLDLLLAGSLDTIRVLRLARGLSMLGGWDTAPTHRPEESDSEPASAWFAAVKLCLHHLPITLPDNRRLLLPSRRSWGRALQSGDRTRLRTVGDEALTILRRAGITDVRTAVPPTCSRLELSIALLVHVPARPLATRLGLLEPRKPKETTP